MADLKPCPFCGSTDVGARKRGPVWRQWVRVNCFYCSTVGPPGTYLEQAVRLWNRRAVAAALDPPPLKVGDRVESDFIEGRVHDASPRIAVIPEPNFSDGLHYPRLADLRRVEKEKP